MRSSKISAFGMSGVLNYRIMYLEFTVFYLIISIKISNNLHDVTQCTTTAELNKTLHMRLVYKC